MWVYIVGVCIYCGYILWVTRVMHPQYIQDLYILWTTRIYCGCISGQCCPQHIRMHPQYIRMHPQYLPTIYTVYILWLHIVDAHVYIVYNILWETYCGGQDIYCGGQGIYCGEHVVGNVLWVTGYILWTRYCGGSGIYCGQHSGQCHPQYIRIHPQYIHLHPQYLPTIYMNTLWGMYCG